MGTPTDKVIAKLPSTVSEYERDVTVPRDEDVVHNMMMLAAELGEELECIICMEQKKLHLLPCAHRCCHDCIVSLAAGGDTVKCPICRREHTTPNEGFPVCLLSQVLKEKLSTRAQSRKIVDQTLCRKSPAINIFKSFRRPKGHPVALQLVSQYDTGSQCISVDYHSVAGDLLIGCMDGTKVMSRDSPEVTGVKHEARDDAMSQLIECNGDLFISCHHKELITISKYDINRMKSYPLFTFPMKTKKISFFSASDLYIAALNKDDHGIELYERVDETLLKFKLPDTERIYHLHFLADGSSLLVTCFHDGKHKVNKYRIAKSAKPEGSVTSLRLIWSSCQLPYARAIAVADNGLIFVSQKGRKRICMLNSDGKMLCELGCDKLPDIHKVISLYGDRLAVAGWDTNAVFIYKVIR